MLSVAIKAIKLGVVMLNVVATQLSKPSVEILIEENELAYPGPASVSFLMIVDTISIAKQPK
jgi:hypothetical protein